MQHILTTVVQNIVNEIAPMKDIRVKGNSNHGGHQGKRQIKGEIFKNKTSC